MLNEYYNFLANHIRTYFNETTSLKAGDRFFLHLEDKASVLNIVEGFKSLPELTVSKEVYKLKDGSTHEYEGLSFELKSGIKVIIASTTNGVNADFLAKLRNSVAVQESGYENSILICILDEGLDTIESGNASLQKAKMPLNMYVIQEKLNAEINDGEIKSVHKQIFIDAIAQIMEDHDLLHTDFLEFKEIFSAIQRKNIAKEDYSSFNLFYDPDLEQGNFTSKEALSRIEENRNLFQRIDDAHKSLDTDSLSDFFTTDIAKKLEDEQWYELEFGTVYKSAEKYQETQKESKITFLENNFSVTPKMEIWDRSAKETAASKRIRNMIVFNSEQLEEFEIELPFEIRGKVRSLNTKYGKKLNESNLSVEQAITKNKIRLNVKVEDINDLGYFTFKYQHEFDEDGVKAKSPATKFEVKVLVVPFSTSLFHRIKTKYVLNPRKKLIELNYDYEPLEFGDFNTSLVTDLLFSADAQEEELKSTENYSIDFDQEILNENLNYMMNLNIDSVPCKFEIKTEPVSRAPIFVPNISKFLREGNENFEWRKSQKKLVQGTKEYNIPDVCNKYFEWEAQWVDKGILHCDVRNEAFNIISLEVDDRLKEAYQYFVAYFDNKKTIPSLTKVDADYYKRAKEYVSTYLELVEAIEEDKPTLKKGIDLFKLGTIVSDNQVYLTPFHPLLVAYKLEFYGYLKDEILDNGTLNRLTPDSLMPFLQFEKRIYKTERDNELKEWVTYKLEKEVSVSDADQYLAKVIKDKLIQFESHFKYLFIQSSTAPIQINVINITNDFEVVKGILEWMVSILRYKNGVEKLKKIEVTIFKEFEFEDDYFGKLSEIKTVDQFNSIFGVKFKNDYLEDEEILEIIQENLMYFKKNISDDLRYAHISFYKMNANKEYGIQNVDDMDSGISMNGLYNSVPYMKYETMYKSGFGTKGYDIHEDELLLKTAKLTNELMVNIRDEGINGYQKNKTLISNTRASADHLFSEVFEKSNWVTFVDPGVGLEFFERIDDSLTIIHYSDQYSSSSRYDAITVTNKTQQYKKVIQNFLEKNEVVCNEQQLNAAIQTFNLINGEWLLRIIGSRENYSREKLSLASAIKYALAYFEHDNITWVPISLEEILRVVGVYNLSKKDGVFTAKNLGVEGEKSDDLLLMGLEQSDYGLKLYMYPIEVKIGFNNSDVINKAKIQAKETSKVFKEVLIDQKLNDFKTDFYRNFFIQLFISNAKKMKQSNLWPEKSFEISDEVKSKLLKQEVEFSSHVSRFIGDAAIISFKTDENMRSATMDLENNLQMLNLTMNDGYKGIIQGIEELRSFIQEYSADFDKTELLKNSFNIIENKPVIKKENVPLFEEDLSNLSNHENQLIEQEVMEDPIEVKIDENIMVNEESTTIDFECETQEEIESDQDKFKIEDVKVEIGDLKDMNRKINWEYGAYGSNGIANRHLLISGASGQGKTYLMQCLLLELSKQGVSTVVIDYTDSFLKKQLDPVFVEELDDKIKVRKVIIDKMPINPFKRYKKDYGDDDIIDEKDVDIAERVKSIFASQFRDLGIQQLNLLYTLVLEGLKTYGDRMSLSNLKKLLLAEGSSTAEKTYSQLVALLDRDPFSLDETIDWKDHIEQKGDVFIVQLTAFTRNVQLLMAEFILWDLWHYSMIEGNQAVPLPVILDEAQNLDHTEGSPSALILTEGRKFGLSGWYATQSVSTLKTDELTRLQNSGTKLYFNPPNSEISTLTKFISSDKVERNQWGNTLQNLSKGECVFSGSVRDSNGDLENNLNKIVKVSSLEERIARLNK